MISLRSYIVLMLNVSNTLGMHGPTFLLWTYIYKKVRPFVSDPVPDPLYRKKKVSWYKFYEHALE